MGDREIALIEDSDERDAIWEEYYFSEWGMLANRKRQAIMDAFWNDPGVFKIDELLKDNEVNKCLHNKGPKYIKDFFSVRETPYKLRTIGVNTCLLKFNLKNSCSYICA